MRKDDAIRLRHMVEAAREALSFSQGKDRKDLTSSGAVTRRTLPNKL